MKQYLTQIKQGLVFGLTASIVICSSIYLLKATRSSTNPWWDASPNDLYVSNGETLKASKRNSAMDKIIRKNIDMNDTTTPFDTNCERRRKDSSNWSYYPGVVVGSEIQRHASAANIYRNIKSSNKKQMQYWNGSTYPWTPANLNITSLQYRCP